MLPDWVGSRGLGGLLAGENSENAGSCEIERVDRFVPVFGRVGNSKTGFVGIRQFETFLQLATMQTVDSHTNLLKNQQAFDTSIYLW